MSVRECENCGARGVLFKKCGRCLKKRYCTQKCQKEDRDRHRPECLSIVEAKRVKQSRRKEVKRLERSRRQASSSTEGGETKSAGSSAVVSQGETKTSNEPTSVSVKVQKKFTKMLQNAMITNNLTMIELLLALNKKK